MPKSEVIYEETWSYRVLRNKSNDAYFLEVLCGTVGIYEVAIKLEGSEIEVFKKNNKDGLSDLVRQIRNNPESFKKRTIKIKDD